MQEATEPDPGEFSDPEEFAEAVGIDPTPQQVDEYQKLVEETAPEPADAPPEEPADALAEAVHDDGAPPRD